MILAFVVALHVAQAAQAGAGGKPCVKVFAGNAVTDRAAKGQAFAVRYGVRPAKQSAKTSFENGVFELCMPKGRYQLVAVTSDNREGAVDVDLTRDKETFLFLDGERLSGDRVEQCMGPPSASAAAMPACEAQREATCTIRGEVKNAAGEPKPYARVSVIVDRGNCYSLDMELESEVTSLVTDAKGQFELTGVACYAATVMTWSPKSCQSSHVIFAQPGTQTVPLTAKD